MPALIICNSHSWLIDDERPISFWERKQVIIKITAEIGRLEPGETRKGRPGECE